MYIYHITGTLVGSINRNEKCSLWTEEALNTVKKTYIFHSRSECKIRNTQYTTWLWRREWVLSPAWVYVGEGIFQQNKHFSGKMSMVQKRGWMEMHSSYHMTTLNSNEKNKCLIYHNLLHLQKWKWSRSVVSDSATPWTVAYEVPLPMEFSRQDYWSGLPFPSPGDLPYPGIEPRSPALQADNFSIWATGEALTSPKYFINISLFDSQRNEWDGYGGQMNGRWKAFAEDDWNVFPGILCGNSARRVMWLWPSLGLFVLMIPSVGSSQDWVPSLSRN